VGGGSGRRLLDDGLCVDRSRRQAGLSVAETTATKRGVFPLVSALHVLLDSLIDRAKDLEHGHHT